MYHTHYLLLLLAGPLVLSHSQEVQEPDDTANRTYRESSQWNTSVYQIAPSNANFAFGLYHLIASQNSGENIFFSPLSISIALAMLSTGAGGNTQTQILEGLRFNLSALSVPEIHEGFRFLQHLLGHSATDLRIYVGNALILSQDMQLLPEFASATETSYNSKVLLANFRDTEATTQLINNYVKEKTHGKIKDLVRNLSPDIRMVLVNFIFFQGLWKKPFSSSRTIESDFYVDKDTVVKVPMMVQYQKEHWYLEDRHVPCMVLRMDYKGNDAVAFFILPHQGKMKEVEQVLSPGMLTRWNHLLQNRYFYRKVTLHFPKFSISNSYALDEILPNLGFQDLFTSRANFSNINHEERLQLSKVFHKATLDVNEVGTEAAASTVSFATFLSAQYEKHFLIFNRPFFLVIYSTSTRMHPKQRLALWPWLAWDLGLSFCLTLPSAGIIGVSHPTKQVRLNEHTHIATLPSVCRFRSLVLSNKTKRNLGSVSSKRCCLILPPKCLTS